jgi:pimeloyl-ACP methyl ester carboxylesterase
MVETVVLVHGVWMTGTEMGLLARRLRDCGYQTVLFRYHSLLGTVTENAQLLRRRINGLGNSPVHLVGHSLGGLLILRALHEQADLVSGRIVLLGSPVNGSIIAQRVNRSRLSRWLIGESGEQALLGGRPRWQGRQSLGVIAGTRPVGVGRLLGGFDGPNDGTVAVSETRLENIAASTSFHSSHFGLVVSKQVAAAVCTFLKQGRFSVEAGLR